MKNTCYLPGKIMQIAQTVQKSHVQALLVFAHVVCEEEVACFSSPTTFLTMSAELQSSTVGLFYQSTLVGFFSRCF